MNIELFTLISQNQNKWRKQYNENKKTLKTIKAVCNRRYKSKSNHSPEQIHKELEKMGVLEQVELKKNNDNFFYIPLL